MQGGAIGWRRNEDLAEECKERRRRPWFQSIHIEQKESERAARKLPIVALRGSSGAFAHKL